jgi:hypothetical protein
MVFSFWSAATPCRLRQEETPDKNAVFRPECRNRRVADSPENGLQAKPATEIRGGLGNPFGLSA